MEIAAALSRMNTGVSHKSDWDVPQEIPPERLYYYIDYVTLRQQLHGTFVTLGVINITAISSARREQGQLKEQRMVESRGLSRSCPLNSDAPWGLPLPRQWWWESLWARLFLYSPQK
jgi:hypothetical protein